MGILINQGRQIGGLSEQDQANIGKVTQTETTTNAEYELLFSETAADATTHTEEARKSSKIIFNPNNQTLKIKSQYDNQTIIKPNSINVDGDKTASMYSGSIVHGFESKTESSHSYAGGYQTQAKGYASHAEGYGTLAGTGQGSHAEGDSTTASGSGSHAEGCISKAYGNYSHAEGYVSKAYGQSSHAEGSQTTTGKDSTSKGAAAHAEGWMTYAIEDCSHAEGLWTYASSAYQHVQGKYNIADANDVYAHIVGNGTANNARSNAYALRWNGQQDVTNDIVRVDSGGTWDGFNASLEDAFKQNLGECNNYDEDTGTYYSWYEIASFDVDPGSYDDGYQYQNDINNPIVLEVSQIVNSSFADSTGYSVLEIAFKFDLNTVKPEILQFLSSNSLDYKLLPDLNWSNIWHLYGRYRSATPIVKNKSILHHVTGSGFHNNVTVVMQNVTDQQTISSIIIDGVSPTRNFVKTSASKGFVRNSAIAANYSNAATYEVGDLCFYQSTPYSNVLYVCNTAISTPEDFDPTHWTQVTLSEYFVKKSGDTMTGTLIGKANSTTSSWKLGRDNASFKKTDVSNASAFYPILSVRGYDHDWSMGTLGNDSNKCLYFVRTFDSDYSGTGNKTQKFGLYGGSSGADSEYVIAHSGNVGTGDSNGQIKIAGTNASVKGLAAAAYKGVFTRSSVGDIGWGTEANRTKVLEVNAIAFWNGRHSGTSSNLQYCDRGRFGTIVTKATGDYLPIGGGTVTGYTIFKQGIEVNKAYSSGTTTNSGGIELFGGNDAFMDFHRLYSSADFTYRITHRGDDTMDFIGHNSSTWGKLRAAQFAVQSSIHVKENVEDITDEEANKILQLRPVSFDYSDKERSDRKNHRGLIAEEVLEIYPEMVDVPNNYTEFNPEEPWNVPSIDYSNFVPYLIKMCQIQQNQINTLTERLDNLNKN